MKRLWVFILILLMGFGMAEILSKRTYQSKSYDLGGGRVQTDICPGDIHHKNDQGNYIDNDYHWEDMGSYFQMVKASHKLYVYKDFGASWLIRYDNKYEKANHTIKFEPHSLWWVHKSNRDLRQQIATAQSVIGVVNGFDIVYQNAFGLDVDFVVRSRGAGLGKFVRIKNASALPIPPSRQYVLVILFKYQATGLKVKARDLAGDWDESSFYESEAGFEIREVATNEFSRIRQSWGRDSTPEPDRRSRRLPVFWEMRNGELWQGKIIPTDWLEQAVFPIEADTLIEPNSDAGGDGITWRQGKATWADAVNGGDADAHDDSTATSLQVMRVKVQSTGTYDAFHGFFPFSLASLPIGKTVESAILKIYGDGSFNNIAEDRGLNVIESNQGSMTALENADHDNPTFGTELCDSRILIADWNIAGYNNFTLNATGKTFLENNAEGWADLGMASGWAIDNSAPPDTNKTGQATGIYADNATNKPILSITYQDTILLVVQEATHPHLAESPTLSQVHNLAVTEALHSHLADNIDLIQVHILAVAEALHSHAVDSPTLIQHYTLVVAEAIHSHLTDSPVLTQAHILAIAEALHAHAVDPIVLTQAHTLAVAEALHPHSVDPITLSQVHNLIISECQHDHSAENIDLITAILLVVADALHNHSADNVMLTQAHLLAVAEALHLHSVDPILLSQVHNLLVAEGLHPHTADNIDLITAILLVVQDALHDHSADGVSLSQIHNLTIIGDVLDHISDPIVLSQIHSLLVNDGTHNHLADLISLILPSEYTIRSGKIASPGLSRSARSALSRSAQKSYTRSARND